MRITDYVTRCRGPEPVRHIRRNDYEDVLCSVFCVLLPRLATSGVPSDFGYRKANPVRIDPKLDVRFRVLPVPGPLSYCTCSVPTYVRIVCQDSTSDGVKFESYQDNLDDHISTKGYGEDGNFACMANTTEGEAGFFQQYYAIPIQCAAGGGAVCSTICENNFSEQGQIALSNALTNCVGYYASKCGPSAQVKGEYGDGAMWYVGAWCDGHPPPWAVTVSDSWEAKEIAAAASCIPQKNIGEFSNASGDKNWNDKKTYCCPFEGGGYTKADGVTVYWTQVGVGTTLSKDKDPAWTEKTCPTGNPEVICAQWKSQ